MARAERDTRAPRRRLAALVAVLVALACLAPCPALASTSLSSDDWEENRDGRVETKIVDLEDGDSWATQLLGGAEKPKLVLTNPDTYIPCLKYFVYEALESAAGAVADATDDLFDSISSISVFDSDYTGYDAGGSETMFRRVYLLVAQIQESAVSPVALGFLGIALVLEMLEFSREVSGHNNDALGSMGNYLWIVVKYAVLIQLIENVDLLCGSVFEVFNWVAEQAASVTTSFSTTVDFASTLLGMQSVTYEDFGLAFLYVLLVVVLFVSVVVLVVRILVVSVTRLIEVYVMSAFAAFPIVMLCHRQTKDAGVRYLRSYAAACLQVAVLAFLVAVSGLVISACTTLFTVPSGVTGFTAALMGVIGPLAGCLAAQALVQQSRALSDKIMGG